MRILRWPPRTPSRMSLAHAAEWKEEMPSRDNGWRES
jgi:hypothetical protein